MNTAPDNELGFVQHAFEHKMSSIKQEDNEIIVSFVGELSQDVISKLETETEEKVAALEVAKGPLKKTFFISVETLQNMFIHGHQAENGEKPVFFSLIKNHQHIIMLSANLVSHSSVPILKKQIETINAFDDEKELKAHYLMHLEGNQLSDKGGAGLGFITIGMKSGNKLYVEFIEINDKLSLFILKSTINLS